MDPDSIPAPSGPVTGDQLRAWIRETRDAMARHEHLRTLGRDVDFYNAVADSVPQFARYFDGLFEVTIRGNMDDNMVEFMIKQMDKARTGAISMADAGDRVCRRLAPSFRARDAVSGEPMTLDEFRRRLG